MDQIALKMLVHDRAKYLGLVLGVAVSIFLINQQVGVFIGMLLRAAAVVRDVPEATIWVMDLRLKNMDTVFPMRGSLRELTPCVADCWHFASPRSIRHELVHRIP